MKIGIIGMGWVGRAVKEAFPEAIVHDPQQGIVDEEAFRAEITFVCVPTPNNEDGSLNTSIVEEVASKCEGLIVVRSTVHPNTCDRIEATGKDVVFQPEYLGESVAHPLMDEAKRQFLIIGGKPENRRKLIELYQTIYNANITIRQMTNLEAEVVKISENRAIMFKVAQAQELYDVCEAAGIDYYAIRDAVFNDDPRQNLWFTFVYPNNRGANSKCIPKDVYAWACWAESLGYEPKITKAILEKNKEWIL